MAGTARRDLAPGTACGKPPELAFLGVSATAFAASAAVTVLWCRSMSGMGDMPMPGGWTMSMAWMRMPDQTWAAAATSFVAMWLVMMVAMMLPSLVPMLRRYREAAGNPPGAVGLGARTALAGAGYFAVWTVLGAALYPAGVALAALEMRLPGLARAVPVATGAIVLAAGALQRTAWKARHLACCRETPSGRRLAADARTAWRHGVRLGLHCARCCAGPTAVLLVLGVMDLRAMAAVTVAITLERLAPRGERFARAIGLVAIAVGAGMIARASGVAP